MLSLEHHQDIDNKDLESDSSSSLCEVTFNLTFLVDYAIVKSIESDNKRKDTHGKAPNEIIHKGSVNISADFVPCICVKVTHFEI